MVTSTNFQAVFFDMDGTLVDTEPYWLQSETELMARYGYVWTPDDQRHCLGGPLPRVGRYMHELAHAEDPEFFVEELVSLVSSKFSHSLNFMPGARELLNEIRSLGVPMGLVSASPRILVDATLSNIGSDVFAVSVSSNDVEKSKPDPESYLMAANHLNVDISQSLVLEDSLTGISAARASGAWVLAIPHIVSVDQDRRTRVVNSLVDLSLAEISSLFTERMDA